MKKEDQIEYPSFCTKVKSWEYAKKILDIVPTKDIGCYKFIDCLKNIPSDTYYMVFNEYGLEWAWYSEIPGTLVNNKVFMDIIKVTYTYVDYEYLRNWKY